MEYAFIMGWQRAKTKVNHATRRQFRKAVNSNTSEGFAIGWFLFKVLSLLGNPKIGDNASYHTQRLAKKLKDENE